jgi:hypothetical protein
MIMISRKLPLLRQLLLAGTLATGSGTVWLVLVMWLGTAIDQAWHGGKRPVREQLVLRKGGTLLVVSTPLDNLSLATYRDTTGRAQDAPDRDELLERIRSSCRCKPDTAR